MVLLLVVKMWEELLGIVELIIRMCVIVSMQEKYQELIAAKKERVERNSGILEQIDYWWGKDLSGKLDGAGGIGGLLYIRKNGCDVYVPLYDAHGNVMQYIDKQGTIVASYAYDAFGNIIQKGGVKADELKVRFSTKYSDDESGLYYFGHRLERKKR